MIFSIVQYVIAFLYGSALAYAYRFFPVASLLLSVLVAVFIAGKTAAGKRRGPLLIIAVAVMAVSGFCLTHFRIIPEGPLSEITGKTIIIRGTVRSGPVPMHSGSGGFSHVMDISRADDNSGKHLSLREMRVISDSAMTPARQYSITVHIPPDAYSMNPGGGTSISGYAVSMRPEYDPSGAMWEGPVRFFGTLRARLNAAITDSLSPASAPFIMALITGERGMLTKETNRAFSVTGLSHLLHKAGLHFGLLLLFFFQSTRFLVRLLPSKLFSLLTLYASPSQIAAIVCLPFVIGYLGISPPDFGTLRAFIMICLFLFGLLLQRRRYWLNSLLAAAFIIVLCQPDSLGNLTFQLSFLSVLCIGLAVGGGQGPDEIAEKRDAGTTASSLTRLRFAFISYSGSSILITLAATLGTAPLIINYFHIFSIISPIANLIVIPIAGFVILPLAFLSCLYFLCFNVFPLHTALDAVTRKLLSSVYYAAHWDFMALKVPAFPPILLIFFYSGIGIYAAMVYYGNRDRLRSLLLPCIVAVVPILIFSVCSLIEKRALSVTFLDVGQGDGAVIELPDHRAMIMDTGKSGFQVGEFLRYLGIDEVEAMALSHPDNDHVGGSGYLLDNFRIRAVWDNGRMEYKDGFLGSSRHKGLQRGDTVSGTGYTITALHPYKNFYSGSGKRFDENNDSLVLRVQGAAASFLFTGDLEKEGEEDVGHLAPYLKSSVLKVAHHGSRSSSSEAFIKAVSPEVAVISAGRNNSYGHPHAETLEVLSGCAANCRIFRTDRDGAIKISEGEGGKVLVKTWRDFQFTEAKGIGDEWMNMNRLFWVW